MKITEEVKKYREEHPRCRTCQYAYQNGNSWDCEAKRESHYGSLKEAYWNGCFCKLYQADLEK